MNAAGLKITPFRLVLGIAGLIVATLLILYRIPSGQYILLPAGAHPVGPLVEVKGGKTPKGSGTIYYVAVYERPASELDTLFPWLHAHASFLPASDFVPPGSTDEAQIRAALRQMAQSQRIAAAVAERKLGYHVVTRPNGVVVDNLYGDAPAAAKINVADVIVAADGKPTLTPAALHAALTPVKPGEVVDLRIRRGSKTLEERVKTVPDPKDPTRAFIGLVVEQSASITTLPRKVSIDANGIGGPSAGLAFTLEVMQQLGANVTHGYKVAATGEMSLNGAVTPIGGIEQKTFGVRAVGADVFLVPVGGDNVRDARRFAGPTLKIVPVRSLAQALHALATLPPKR